MNKSNSKETVVFVNRESFRVKLTVSLANSPRNFRPPTGVVERICLDHSVPTVVSKLLKYIGVVLPSFVSVTPIVSCFS